MNIVAIIQARSSSSRLPGKVLMPILGKAMILRQLERIQLAQNISSLIVATSIESSDDELVAVLEKEGIGCYRGSLDDVLDRYYEAAKLNLAEHIIRLTGDCPLIDPDIIDQVISTHLRDGNDYTSNTLAPTFPDGLDVEVIKFETLQDTCQQAGLPSEREHVTPYILKHPEMYKLGNVSNCKDLSALRWTVDEPEDFELIATIYNKLYPLNPQFAIADILEFLENNPELKKKNQHIEYNEGMKKSLQADRDFLQKTNS